MTDVDPKAGPLHMVLKTYVLPAVFWCVAAVGTVTFISKDVTDRLERIENAVQKVQEEQEAVKRQINKVHNED